MHKLTPLPDPMWLVLEQQHQVFWELDVREPVLTGRANPRHLSYALKTGCIARGGEEWEKKALQPKTHMSKDHGRKWGGTANRVKGGGKEGAESVACKGRAVGRHHSGGGTSLLVVVKKVNLFWPPWASLTNWLICLPAVRSPQFSGFRPSPGPAWQGSVEDAT